MAYTEYRHCLYNTYNIGTHGLYSWCTLNIHVGLIDWDGKNIKHHFHITILYKYHFLFSFTLAGGGVNFVPYILNYLLCMSLFVKLWIFKYIVKMKFERNHIFIESYGKFLSISGQCTGLYHISSIQLLLESLFGQTSKIKLLFKNSLPRFFTWDPVSRHHSLYMYISLSVKSICNCIHDIDCMTCVLISSLDEYHCFITLYLLHNEYLYDTLLDMMINTKGVFR